MSVSEVDGVGLVNRNLARGTVRLERDSVSKRVISNTPLLNTLTSYTLT